VTAFLKEAEIVSIYIFGWGRSVFGRGRGNYRVTTFLEVEEVVSGNIFGRGTGSE
jgi:hypothetical protein